MESSYSRVRSVKLGRASEDSPFGFSVRGGHEHGTGIFVSFVDPRSNAFKTGLKVGDQILRVNGFPVSAAVHHECLALMRLRPSLHLKVRSVGMLPVKERNGDPLTWKLVEEQPQPSLIHHHQNGGGDENGNNGLNGSGSGGRGYSRLSDTSSSSPHPSPSPHHHSQHLPPQEPPPTMEAKVFIDMTGRNGLGCCICKGPVERPGIFVQSTKANGVAREAGLRPGDQIISSNGHSFLHVPFAEAVQHLKSAQLLRLRVLKGAASDLFPRFPDSSSGYNSSASSLNGDSHQLPQQQNGSEQQQQQHHQRQLRLLPQDIHNTNHHTNGSGGSGEGGMALDERMEWNEVERVWRSAERETIVIEVKGVESSEGGSGSGHHPSNHHHSEEQRQLAEERRKLEQTQARLLEEALKLEEEKRKWEEEKRRSTAAGGGGGGINSRSNSSTTGATSGGGGSASNGVGNGLAGALHQEILKRNERRCESGVGEGGGEGEELGGEEDGILPKPGTVEAKRTLFNSQIDQEKRQQHEQLIEEFKRAHRKMFSHAPISPAASGGGDEENAADAAAAELIRARRVQKELDHERQMVAQRVAGIVRQRQLRIERQHQESAETEREILAKSPPPPPPMPHGQGQSSRSNNKGPAPPPPNNPTTASNGALAPHILQQQQPKRVLILEENKNLNLKKVGGRDNAGRGPVPPSNPGSGSGSKKGKAPPTPQRTITATPTTTTTGNGVGNNNNGHVNDNGHVNGDEMVSTRPASPSPDYSNSPSPSPTRAAGSSRGGSTSRGGGGGGGMNGNGTTNGHVDMQSLESYRLKEPPRSCKKPPPVYFPHGGGGANNGAAASASNNNQQHQHNVGGGQMGSGSGFVEGNNAKNTMGMSGGGGILKGAKTISFLEKY